ncbi:uncharacterized protein [Rutidosis leptorrhynchoides]|uniref:uncharacterized protein n=1 Tax=Rutidosis leptorrhynchoides TaxID=125765 RepID=UPI003A9A29FA
MIGIGIGIGLGPVRFLVVVMKECCYSFEINNRRYNFLTAMIDGFGLWTPELKVDAIPLRCNLFARGVDVNTLTCPVCSNRNESRDHVFFCCSLADEVWHNIRIWIGCNLPSFLSWEEFHSWIEASHLASASKNKICAITVTLLWVIWRFRNGIAFNEPFCTRNNIVDLIKYFAYRWLKHRGQLVSNWNLWLLSPL